MPQNILIVKTSIRVRYAETDQMGIAHHSNYLRWFEIGRIHLLDAIGFSYQAMEKRGEFLPVVEMGIKYLQSCTFDDLLELETRFLEIRPSRVIFGSFLRNHKDNSAIARAYSTHGMTDTRGLSRVLPEDFRKTIEPNVDSTKFFTRKRKAFRY